MRIALGSLSLLVVLIGARVAAQEIVSKTAKLGDQNKTNMKAGVVYQVVVESDAFYPALESDLAANGEIKQMARRDFVPATKLKHRRDFCLKPAKDGNFSILVSDEDQNAKAGEYKLTIRKIEFGKQPLLEAKVSLKEEGDGKDHPFMVTAGKRYLMRIDSPKFEALMLLQDPARKPEERILFVEALQGKKSSSWMAFEAARTAKLNFRVESINQTPGECKITVFEK